MKAVIVIPCYRCEMSKEERASFLQCAEIFGDRRKIVLAAPESLDCSAYQEILPRCSVERFEDKFFASVSTYSWLLLTPEFYRRFQADDYMLIYQLDAWVFRDELDQWCEKGYDYIGAPFVLKWGHREKIIVGNGGFSLRRISAMLRVLEGDRKKMFPSALLKEFFMNHIVCGNYVRGFIPLLKMWGLFPNSRGKYLEQIRHEKYNSEDMVFYFLSRQFTDDGLTMPDIDEAACFSLDGAPERFFKKLPFGCHAWMKGDAEFWKKYITAENELCAGESIR